ncbi:MAG: VWA domain-containing protein [Flavobacteriales bacterium]|nr:VWA domain-containing protein [Flavobacteriales bacterium]
MFPAFADIAFKNPELLWLLVLLPLMVAYHVFLHRKNMPQFRYSSIEGARKAASPRTGWLTHIPAALRTLAVGLLIVAVARPQSSSSWQDVTTEGIDIVLCLDISGSMLAEDFKPNRLEASKKVAQNFLQGRPNDRVGLVIFAAESFTQCPLTTDHSILLNLFQDVKTGMLEDGTAIGLGLATSVQRLKDSEAVSKVVILLTDGDNNAGSIAPMTAAEIAREFGVRVYTIGVGTRGTAPFPFTDPFGRTRYQDMEVRINEPLLKEMAQMTGGKYFRATDNAALESVYSEIDALEKSKIDVTEYRKRKEEFLPFALLALLLVIGEVLVRHTILRSLIN